MTPAQAIAMLDSQLAEHGETVVVSRMASGIVAASASVRAFVRGYKPEEITGTVRQGDVKITLSPTGLGGAEPERLDRIVVGGKAARTVEAVEVVRLAGTVVRYNVQARG